MGKIELEVLRKRARALGMDPGSLARAARAQRSISGIGSRQTGIHELPAPVLVAPRALPMDEVRRWVVAVCRPQMARGVALDLNELGFVAYCPLGRKTVYQARARVGRRKRIHQTAVFGRYLFVGEVEEPLSAWVHDGISEIIGDSAGPWALDQRAVRAINEAEIDGKWDETKIPAWARTFKIGDAVRIGDGPLTGFQGLVEAFSKAGIRVDLDLFGRRTSTTLKPSALELA
jgi:transcription antitermination factor NusG